MQFSKCDLSVVDIDKITVNRAVRATQMGTDWCDRFITLENSTKT